MDVNRATDVNGVKSKINGDARIHRHIHRCAADGNGDRRADDVGNSKCRHAALDIQFKAGLAGFVGERQVQRSVNIEPIRPDLHINAAVEIV